MSNTSTRTSGPINFTALTDGQRSQIDHVAQVGGRIALQQTRARKAIEMAMQAHLFDMLATADAKLVEQIFDGLLAVATRANAKRIAQHPLCPPRLVTLVEDDGDGDADDPKVGGKPAKPETTDLSD